MKDGDAGISLCRSGYHIRHVKSDIFLFLSKVGLIMYFVRTPCEWGMDAISATLTFLWEVVGYVEGLFFKDLKQTMKKEQCEVKLLVTASMPGCIFQPHSIQKIS